MISQQEKQAGQGYIPTKRSGMKENANETVLEQKEGNKGKQAKEHRNWLPAYIYQ
jgi:hypothetical protein